MRAKQFNELAKHYNSKVAELNNTVYTIDYLYDAQGELEGFNINEHTILEYLNGFGGDFENLYIDDDMELNIYTENLGNSLKSTAKFYKDSFAENYKRHGMKTALQELIFHFRDTSENNPEPYFFFYEAKEAAEQWIKDNA